MYIRIGFACACILSYHQISIVSQFSVHLIHKLLFIAGTIKTEIKQPLILCVIDHIIYTITNIILKISYILYEDF